MTHLLVRLCSAIGFSFFLFFFLSKEHALCSRFASSRSFLRLGPRRRTGYAVLRPRCPASGRRPARRGRRPRNGFRADADREPPGPLVGGGKGGRGLVLVPQQLVLLNRGGSDDALGANQLEREPLLLQAPAGLGDHGRRGGGPG